MINVCWFCARAQIATDFPGGGVSLVGIPRGPGAYMWRHDRIGIKGMYSYLCDMMYVWVNRRTIPASRSEGDRSMWPDRGSLWCLWLHASYILACVCTIVRGRRFHSCDEHADQAEAAGQAAGGAAAGRRGGVQSRDGWAGWLHGIDLTPAMVRYGMARWPGSPSAGMRELQCMHRWRFDMTLP
jgi:hypothetical protein